MNLCYDSLVSVAVIIRFEEQAEKANKPSLIR